MSSSLTPYRLDQEFWELHQSASNLTRYACMISARHIKDGVLRGRFNRELTYYVRQVLDDVMNGRISTGHALKVVEVEHEGLKQLAVRLGLRALGDGRKILGLVAGAAQVSTGATLCATVAGCVVGLPLALHGGNNIYENVSNLSRGASDSVGPARTLYRDAATALGGTAAQGDIAYAGMDIGLSVRAIFTKVKKDGAWRLFKSIESDYARLHTRMSKLALWFEAVANVNTAEQAYRETKK